MTTALEDIARRVNWYTAAYSRSMSDSNLDAFELDRRFFRVRGRDEDSGEGPYWMTQPPERRIQAIEFLRESFHGRAYSSQRLERLLRLLNVHDVRYGPFESYPSRERPRYTGPETIGLNAIKASSALPVPRALPKAALKFPASPCSAM